MARADLLMIFCSGWQASGKGTPLPQPTQAIGMLNAEAAKD